MDYFKLCSKIIQEEKRKCNLDHQEIIRRTVDFSLCDNFFESPYDRCAFMYKNATCIISFTKYCVYQFLQECPIVTNMLLKWKVQPSLHFCSFSHGPALDYLSFCVALSENVEVNLQPSFSSVNVISNSAQWKHAIHFMIQSIEMGYLNSFPVSSFCDNFNVNQNPRLAFNEKQKIAVQDADVVFMVKTLNFSKPDEFEGRKKYFQNIISAMKPDSYLFCIDTKPSISAMFDIFCQIPGQLIYGPVLNAYQLPEKFPETFKEIYGCLPVVSARGNFFVWKKISLEFQVPNLCTTDSEKLPTNPRISINCKASGLNQDSPVETILKHDITTELSEVCYGDKKSIDLFSNQNYTVRNKKEDLSSQLLQLYNFYSNKKSSEDLEKTLIDISSDSTTTNEQNSVSTEDVAKSVLSNICDAIDQKCQPVTILDHLFSSLSSETSKISPKTTCFVNDISFGASFGSNECDLQGINQSIIITKDLTSESGSLLSTPTYDFKIQSNSVDSSNIISSLESPVLLNENLNTTKLTDSLTISNFIEETSSFQNINEMGDDFDSKQLGSSKARQNAGSLSNIRRELRRRKKLLNASPNSKGSKIIQSSTPVKVISLSSSVCAMPTSCNTNFIQDFHGTLNTNIEKGTVKTQSIGRGFNNSDKNESFLNAGLIKDNRLIDEDKNITSYGINKSNNSPCHTSSIVPKNNESFSHLFQKTVSTTTDIDKSYADNCGTIQHLTDRIKTLVTSFNQILNQKEINAAFREDDAIHQFHNHLCSCLPSNKNIVNNDDCFQSSNNTNNLPKRVDENFGEERKNSKLEPKSFCLPQSSVCCATQFGYHQCCACECRKVHGCAFTATPTYPLHGCFHNAKRVPSSADACSRCVTCEGASPTAPNIVIPLQNITEDTLAQILAILKTTNVHSSK